MRPRRVLITGVTGFAGQHLASLCLAEGARVVGLSRSGWSGPVEGSLAADVDLRPGDLSSAQSLRTLISDSGAEIVFHLAAETAFAAPASALLQTNVLGTLNLIEAAAWLPNPPRLLVASSSAVYGMPDDPSQPLGEDSPLMPASPYGLSKAAQDAIAERLGRANGVTVIRARAFNHTGPGEKPAFVASSVARQIALAELGLGPRRLLVGRMDTLRDFCDVRDIVRGYWLAATRGAGGAVFNLARGQAVSIEQLVRGLAGLARVEVEIVQDPDRMRPSDVPCQVGDPGRARRELGWEPRIPLETMLSDLLDYWRAAVPKMDEAHESQG